MFIEIAISIEEKADGLVTHTQYQPAYLLISLPAFVQLVTSIYSLLT